MGRFPRRSAGGTCRTSPATRRLRRFRVEFPSGAKPEGIPTLGPRCGRPDAPADVGFGRHGDATLSHLRLEERERLELRRQVVDRTAEIRDVDGMLRFGVGSPGVPVNVEVRQASGLGPSARRVTTGACEAPAGGSEHSEARDHHARSMALRRAGTTQMPPHPPLTGHTQAPPTSTEPRASCHRGRWYPLGARAGGDGLVSPNCSCRGELKKWFREADIGRRAGRGGVGGAVPGGSSKLVPTSAKLPGALGLRVNVLCAGRHLGKLAALADLGWARPRATTRSSAPGRLCGAPRPGPDPSPTARYARTRWVSCGSSALRGAMLRP